MSPARIEEWLSTKVTVTLDDGSQRTGFLHRVKEGVYVLPPRRVASGPNITIDMSQGESESLEAKRVVKIEPA